MQQELIFPPSEPKAAEPEPAKRKHVQVRKPVTLQGQDGRIIGSVKRTREQVISDFWKRVKRGNLDECWEWQAGRNDKPPNNYGVMWVNGEKLKTHVYSYELHYGPLAPGLWVLHKCDNPPCVNPAHLFSGTAMDNVRDMISKGRDIRERGVDRYNATLTEDDIREIRRRYVKRDKVNGCGPLGKEFGVGLTMIFAIVTRRRWKHVK